MTVIVSPPDSKNRKSEFNESNLGEPCITQGSLNYPSVSMNMKMLDRANVQ